jgi:hypothetical protein
MPQDILDAAQLHRLARLGAVARLRELEEEAAAIRRAFPGLKKTQDAMHESPSPVAAKKPAKRKRNVSPEARKAAAERMRAYWAKKKGESPSAATEAATGGNEGAAGAGGTARRRARKKATRKTANEKKS